MHEAVILKSLTLMVVVVTVLCDSLADSSASQMAAGKMSGKGLTAALEDLEFSSPCC